MDLVLKCAFTDDYEELHSSQFSLGFLWLLCPVQKDDAETFITKDGVCMNTCSLYDIPNVDTNLVTIAECENNRSKWCNNARVSGSRDVATPGPHRNINAVFPRMKISIIKIRRSWYGLMFTLLIRYVYTETAPGRSKSVLVVCLFITWSRFKTYNTE